MFNTETLRDRHKFKGLKMKRWNWKHFQFFFFQRCRSHLEVAKVGTFPVTKTAWASTAIDHFQVSLEMNINHFEINFETLANCLGHSYFMIGTIRKVTNNYHSEKCDFKKLYHFFPLWDFEDFFWKKVAQMYSHVFERRRKIDLRIQAGTLCGGRKKIFIYLFVCFNSPGMTCRKTHPRLHFIEAPNFC